MNKNVIKHPKERVKTSILRFFSSLTVMYVAATTVGIFITSYLGYRFTEIVMFKVNDGWCSPGTEGIGDHCFGDFYGFFSTILKDPWGGTPSAYPPISMLYLKFGAEVMSRYPNQNFLLLLHLLLMILCLVFPIYHMWATGRIKSLQLSIALGIGILSTAPAIMVLDRGNNVVLLVPLLYLFYIKFLAGQTSKALTYGVIMTLWRPQMILLVFAFIALREWRTTAKWILYSIVGTLASFALFPWNDYGHNLKSWIKNLIGYQTYESLPSLEPANWSFANVIATVGNIFSSLSHGTMPILGSNYAFPASGVPIVSLLFLVGTGIVIFSRGNRGSRFTLLFIVSCLPILIPSVTYSYYLVILLVPLTLFASLLNSSLVNPTKYYDIVELEIFRGANSIFATRISTGLFYLTFFSILIPWPIPWRFFGVDGISPLGSIGINWTIGLIAFVLWFLVLLFNHSKSKYSVQNLNKRVVEQEGFTFPEVPRRP